MSYTPYTFPAFPNVETRQQNNALRDGRLTGVQYAVPSNVVAQNTNPNPYVPSSTYNQPGTQVFGLGRGYEEAPQTEDTTHREMNITINQPFLYRSHLGTPRRESAA